MRKYKEELVARLQNDSKSVMEDGVEFIVKPIPEIEKTSGMDPRNDVCDLGGGDVAVGKINQLVVRRGNLGVEDADLAHGAGFSADLDEIADLERVRGKKDHGAGKIGKRVLNGKGNGKPCNAQNGKQR